MHFPIGTFHVYFVFPFMRDLKQRYASVMSSYNRFSKHSVTAARVILKETREILRMQFSSSLSDLVRYPGCNEAD